MMKQIAKKVVPQSLIRARRRKLAQKASKGSNDPIRRVFPGYLPTDDVSEAFLGRVFKRLNNEMYWLLQIRFVREWLAKERLQMFDQAAQIQQVKDNPVGNANNTKDYNLKALYESVDLDRPSVIVAPLLAIEEVYKNINSLDVLSVGPRSEIEIFNIMGAGFNLSRIKSIDLFTYSPYIELGDMHKTQFKDNSFDVILLGWVVSYSKDWAAMKKEMLRIAKPGAFFSISADYSHPSKDSQLFKGEEEHVQNCDKILDLFKDEIDTVYFRHDPKPPKTAMNMVVFQIK